MPEEVVDAFGAARLLAFDHDPATREPTVEVAHEALIRNWPRLRAWLAEDRDALRVLRHLSDSAGAWDARGRDAGELYRGARLAAATDLVATSPDRLTDLESEFVSASRDAADADEHRRRRNTRRLRRFAVGLGVALGVRVDRRCRRRRPARNADDAATEARQQAALAQEQTKVARARRLLSEAQVIAPENLQVALLLASEAVDLDPTINTAGLIGLIPPRLERIQTFGGQPGFAELASDPMDERSPYRRRTETSTCGTPRRGRSSQTLRDGRRSFRRSPRRRWAPSRDCGCPQWRGRGVGPHVGQQGRTSDFDGALRVRSASVG